MSADFTIFLIYAVIVAASAISYTFLYDEIFTKSYIKIVGDGKPNPKKRAHLTAVVGILICALTPVFNAVLLLLMVIGFCMKVGKKK